MERPGVLANGLAAPHPGLAPMATDWRERHGRPPPRWYLTGLVAPCQLTRAGLRSQSARPGETSAAAAAVSVPDPVPGGRDGVAAVLRAEDGRLRDRAQRLGRHHADPAGHFLQRPLGRAHRGRPGHGGRLPRQRAGEDLPALQPSQLQLLHRGRPLRPPGGLLFLPSAAQQAEGVHGPLRTPPHPQDPTGCGP